MNGEKLTHPPIHLPLLSLCLSENRLNKRTLVLCRIATELRHQSLLEKTILMRCHWMCTQIVPKEKRLRPLLRAKPYQVEMVRCCQFASTWLAKIVSSWSNLTTIGIV